LDYLDVLNNVVIRQYVPAAINNDPCSHSVDLTEWIGASRLRLFRSYDLSALDIHDRRSCPLDRLDNRRPAQ
jgi:hypothetical protein